MADDPRSAALHALSTYLVADAPLGDALLHVASTACGAVDGADLVGISMQGLDGRPATRVATAATAEQVDAAQYASGRSPCLDAWRTARSVRVGDLRAAHEYPEFAAACLEHGIASTLSLPLVAHHEAVGALNLYSSRVDAFDDEAEALAADLSRAAAALVLNAAAYWQAIDLTEGLGEAMRSRAVIEQAKGVLMAGAPELDPDAAFDVLRRASQRTNTKLRVVAERVVAQRRLEG